MWSLSVPVQTEKKLLTLRPFVSIWVQVGITQGRGKLEKSKQGKLPKKYILLYPLVKDYGLIVRCRQDGNRPGRAICRKQESSRFSNGSGDYS